MGAQGENILICLWIRINKGASRVCAFSITFAIDFDTIG